MIMRDYISENDILSRANSNQAGIIQDLRKRNTELLKRNTELLERLEELCYVLSDNEILPSQVKKAYEKAQKLLLNRNRIF